LINKKFIFSVFLREKCKKDKYFVSART